jgi:hypothetical protein
MRKYRRLAVILPTAFLSACASMPPAVLDAPTQVAPLVEGPPIEDIVTPYDEALACMQGEINPKVSFAVGKVVDSTGKETYTNGGTGKFVSQGAGEMVQSALFRAGVTVVNRRDAAVSISETNWGIRTIDNFLPANFYVSGSVNSLDFIPGGGASATINGIGPRYRQNRILIGLDLALTDSHSGIVVANASLQKQIFAREVGFSTDKFFGTTLVGVNIGAFEREALQFSLRQMLQLATLELLGSIAGDDALSECREKLGELDAGVRQVEATYRNRERQKTIRAAIKRAKEGPKKPQNAASAQATSSAGATEESSEPPSRQARMLGRQATALAGRAIAAMEQSMNAQDPERAAAFAQKSAQLVKAAVEALRKGAKEGLNGPEGDGAALIVEQALQAVQRAQERAATLSEGGETTTESTDGRSADAADADETASGSIDNAGGTGPRPRPGTPEYERRFGRP